MKMPVLEYELRTFNWGDSKEGIYRCTHPGCSGGTCPAFSLEDKIIPEEILNYLSEHAALHSAGL